MFIAQVMYAEGLVKIIEAILATRQNHEEIAYQRQWVQKEIQTLEVVEILLYNTLPHSSTLKAVREEIRRKNQAIKEELRMYPLNPSLLAKCGIKTEEHKEKFHLIAADVLRISHGSVKPPAWIEA